ncbi:MULTISPECIES: HalOD1 output domain-containing protein [Haloarcula]|uniref:HalOD1 output domain-containing protein n=1 Tax=Haloarcula TaxID=2237 RepID=UPI0023EC8A38|nr:HalOD1 output domain-containing protein [Halomicroarcula sp. XH51]
MAETKPDSERIDSEHDTYRSYITNERPATQTIAGLLAEIEGCSPLDVGPLADSIDTDALNKLVAQSTDEDFRITFSIDGYTAEVAGDRSVVITRS